ncbi:acyl-CoA dehydrogenase family protein [Tumebacillus flagellatus]|uniref:Acyl-CoA dehydrogenase n=1 Tax=Tumebacillus flagellatus TaxID=1157490 RepID=A0A074LN83_9BACL|nr:acyl-CoA dehydrogenase family protein [Tumebacillus flagellatus]KEO82564.1 hypothetical protein EL26_14350 [Tumebacillus flagellatus]
MRVFDQYLAAEDMERYLGDPLCPGSRISFQRVVELDEADQYPQEFLSRLHEWGYMNYLVPKPFGGQLRSLEELFALSRVIARRDLTSAVATGVCLLGALPVWLRGTDSQRARAAELLMGGGKMGFALSEKERGHDLIANDLSAWANEEGHYLLNGEKWTIGNATRSDALTLYVKTADTNNPRSHSILFVDKKDLNPSTFENTPKIKTLGLRGHDLSGIRFQDSPVSQDTMVGQPGDGLLLATQTTLITRSLCSSFMLASADTLLRSTLQFAKERHLYGKPVTDMQYVRATLTEVFVDTLIADCLATVTMRGLHVITDQASIWAAAVKYFVPTSIERSLLTLNGILGARFFLREEHQFGIYQKFYRDAPIVSVFEGGSYSNLQAIALQLRQLLKPKATEPQALRAELEAIFDLQHPVPEWLDASQLDLHSHGRNTALDGLDLIDELMRDRISDRVAEATRDEIAALIEELKSQVESLRTLTRKLHPDKSSDQMEVARRYVHLHTAAIAVHTWLFNPEHPADFFRTGEWLVLALRRLLYGENPSMGFAPRADYVENVFQALETLFEENRLFALVPISLGAQNEGAI